MSEKNIFIQSSYRYDWLVQGFRHFSKHCITKWPEMSSSILNMNIIVLHTYHQIRLHLQLKRLWVLVLPDFVLVLGTTVLYFCWVLVLFSWQAFTSSLIIKLEIISQLPSNFTLPFAGGLKMQQCHLTYIFTFPNKCQTRMEPKTYLMWVFYLNTRRRCLASVLDCYNFRDRRWK